MGGTAPRSRPLGEFLLFKHLGRGSSEVHMKAVTRPSRFRMAGRLVDPRKKEPFVDIRSTGKGAAQKVTARGRAENAFQAAGPGWTQPGNPGG